MRKMREFSHFNQILLSLFDVSSAFYDSNLNCLHRLTYFRFNVNSNIITKCV